MPHVEPGMAAPCGGARLGVVIFGQEADPHVAEVARRLRVSSVEVLVLDQYRDQLAVSFPGGGTVGAWPIVDWAAALDGVALWSRVKRPMGAVRPDWSHLSAGPDDPAGPYQTAHFWRAEWHVFRLSLEQRLLELPNVVTINPGTLGRFAVCKPLQLDMAARVGFAVPRTVIGNDEAAIDGAFGEQLLYKPLSGEVAAGIGVPPPAMLAKEEVLAEGRASIAPGIFQDRVSKKHELRVTVAGERIVAVRIDSQAVRFARLDWRRAQHRTDIFQLTSLQPEHERRIRRYMAAFALEYGAFDFAVDLDDQLVFFECNPEGQWLWMEPAIGPCISDAVAEMIRSAAASAAAVGAHALRAEPA